MQTLNPDLKTPFAQWEEVEVIFTPTANTDTIVPTALTPSNPEDINYCVTRTTSACRVYHDGSSARIPWSRGSLRLRCDVGQAKVRLLLWVSHQTPYFTQTF